MAPFSLNHSLAKKKFGYGYRFGIDKIDSSYQIQKSRHTLTEPNGKSGWLWTLLPISPSEGLTHTGGLINDGGGSCLLACY